MKRALELVPVTNSKYHQLLTGTTVRKLRHVKTNFSHLLTGDLQNEYFIMAHCTYKLVSCNCKQANLN